jgi:hypothetical protein
VKDILTPLGAAPHPPRSLALVATRRLPNPHASGGRHHTPRHPPRRQGSAKQWQKKVLIVSFPGSMMPNAPRALSFSENRFPPHQVRGGPFRDHALARDGSNMLRGDG